MKEARWRLKDKESRYLETVWLMMLLQCRCCTWEHLRVQDPLGDAMVAGLGGGRGTACGHVHLNDLTEPMKSAAASSSYDSELFESFEGSRRTATPHARELWVQCAFRHLKVIWARGTLSQSLLFLSQTKAGDTWFFLQDRI